MEEIKQSTTRKGPWTEEEDMQLVYFVTLFGERRWDFIAKVSGLHRTGKSCRLRWVNYLHPGLKRGRMSPQEERLVLELHSRWGNRWSRIARKLPGRTDNEIKNYWRTHMRKKAQERKRNASARASLTASSSSSTSTTSAPAGCGETPLQPKEIDEMELDDVKGCYPMEKIWDEIESSEMSGPKTVGDFHFKEENWCINDPSFHPPICSTSSYDDAGLWKINEEEEELKTLMMSIGCCDLLVSNLNNHSRSEP